MEQVYRRCCGLDVHKDSVEVCVLPAVGTSGKTLRKRYGTFRSELIGMRAGCVRGGFAAAASPPEAEQSVVIEFGLA